MPIKNYPFTTIWKGAPAGAYIPINLINPNTGLRTSSLARVDTGADECAMPAKLTIPLKHEFTKGEKKFIRTASNKTEVAYAHNSIVELLSMNGKLLYTIKKVPIDFMPGLRIPLLGVKHFLDQFVLRIDYPKKVFSITWE